MRDVERSCTARSATPRVAAAAVLLAALAALAVPAGADSAPPRAEPGSVETIVGPGVCPDAGVLGPKSNAVGALVIDADGTTFVDAGPPELGAVTVVDASGQPASLRTGVPSTPGRLAPDGQGGVLVAAPARVDQHQAGGGIITIAGDPLASQGTASSGDGGPAGEARFAKVLSLASDEAGNVYVADALDEDAGTFRIRFVNRSDEPVSLYPGTAQEITVAPGHIDTIAGAPDSRGGGDGGSALAATLQGKPPALAAMPGRLYMAGYDATGEPATADVRVINLAGRQLTAHGVQVAPGAIQTVAGGGPAGFNGDGGSARRASLGRMPGIGVDAAGNLYLADADHHRVRRVDRAGTISTFAGAGPTSRGGFNGNDRPATRARLDTPFDIGASPGGQVYIADRGNGQLRVVNDEGAIHAAPGNGLQQGWACRDGSSGTWSAAGSRPMEAAPVDVAADDRGHLYFPVATDYARNPLPVIYRRDRSGRVAPVIGALHNRETCSECPVGTTATLKEAPLVRPVAVAIPRSGGLYVLDAAEGRLWLANLGSRPLPAHGLTVAEGTAAVVATDTMRQDAGGGTLAADDRGNVFIADLRQVRRLDERGGLTTIVEGLDIEGLNRPDPPAGCCAMPAGLAVDGDGNLYVSDPFSLHVWYLNQTDEPVTVHGQSVGASDKAVVAGSGERGFGGDGGPAVDAELEEPTALTVGPDGDLYIIDASEHTVRRVDAAGAISTVVGGGSPGFNGDGLQAGVTTLNTPAALATDDCGNLLIADVFNQRVRRWKVLGPCATPVSSDTPAAPTAQATRFGLLAGLAGLGMLLAVGVSAGRRRRRQPARPFQPQ